VEWQLHQAGRLCEFGLFNIIGNGHGPRRGTEGQTSSARHAWILRLGHCLAVSCSEIFDFRGSRCGVLAGQRRSRERAYVHRVVARVVGALKRARLSESPAARGPATSSRTVTALKPAALPACSPWVRCREALRWRDGSPTTGQWVEQRS
jgi:hypothetical protein